MNLIREAQCPLEVDVARILALQSSVDQVQSEYLHLRLHTTKLVHL